jgi:hypothetical protein
LRAATVDELFEFRTGNNTLIGRAPRLVMGGGNLGCIGCPGGPDFDQDRAHEVIKATRRALDKVYR